MALRKKLGILLGLCLNMTGLSAEAAQKMSSTDGKMVGVTCQAGLLDEYENAMMWGQTWGQDGVYYDACDAAYSAGLAQCNSGYTTVYRSLTLQKHWETRLQPLGQIMGGRIEGAFHFSATPRPGASQSPIYRCPYNYEYDFPSLSANCEGQGAPISALGYSYAANTPGVRPVYRCRVGGDHFISWASNCEGQIKDGLFGYAW